MIPTPAHLLRRLVRFGRPPPVDVPFVARVREQIEPPLAAAGFGLRSAAVVRDGRRHATVVRYAADPAAFAQRFPGARDLLRAEGEPLEFWITRDTASGTVRSELEGFAPAALLAAARSGPGAPPLRRRHDELPSSSPEAAVDRVAEVLQRFLAVAAID